MKRIALAAVSFWIAAAHAQAGQQPSPFSVPQTPAPPAAAAPGQSAVPAQQAPSIAPDAPLPGTQTTTVPLRDVRPLANQPATPDSPSAALSRVNGTATPQAELGPSLRGRFIMYSARRLPAMPVQSANRLSTLVRDGKLYLSLHDALALAIENSLAVEVTRYDLLAAETDVKRSAGGGTLRSVGSTVVQLPPGAGETSSPLIAVQSATNNPTSTNAAVVDLSNVTQTGGTTARDLGINGASTFSAGPSIPFFDPTLIGQAGYLRRSNTTSLINTTGTDSSSTGSTTTAGPLGFVNASLDYQQGFSTGTQIDAFADNSPQVLYGTTSGYNPFHSPSTSITVSQPLLRGFGRSVNLRFLRIARLERKESRAVFQQQLMETVYGISRLYYDLVSLGENIGVKEISLATAEQLFRDDKDQVDLGTLAPIELTRAQALVSSARLDLVQARGVYRQQEAILRQQLLRDLGQPLANFAGIVPTDTINVPQEQPSIDVSSTISGALQNRPDLAFASLQLEANQVEVNASRNAVKPLVNAYANVQTRGSSLVPYTQLGSTGTTVVTPNPAVTTGGLRLSTIYQAGVQVNLPLRNRIAQADAERDAINLRQSQARSLSLQNEVRQQVENAAIALENAHQSYAAAVESRNYQQQLLQAEKDKFALGQSTNFLIVQDESYLAQARSTEVAARSNWMKASIALDRATGSLLEKNNVVLEDAISGTVK